MARRRPNKIDFKPVGFDSVPKQVLTENDWEKLRPLFVKEDAPAESKEDAKHILNDALRVFLTFRKNATGRPRLGEMKANLSHVHAETKSFLETFDSLDIRSLETLWEHAGTLPFDPNNSPLNETSWEDGYTRGKQRVRQTLEAVALLEDWLAKATASFTAREPTRKTDEAVDCLVERLQRIYQHHIQRKINSGSKTGDGLAFGYAVFEVLTLQGTAIGKGSIREAFKRSRPAVEREWKSQN